MASVEEVEELCQSEVLSLEALRQKIQLLPPEATSQTSPSFLHRACTNEHIKLDIVEYLVGTYPESVNTVAVFCDEQEGGEKCTRWETSAYPLHIACKNEGCDPSILTFLMKKNMSALRKLCFVAGGVLMPWNTRPSRGLPLHYLLMRKYKDIDTVSLLVEAYPEALVIGEPAGDDLIVESGVTPVHTILDYLPKKRKGKGAKRRKKSPTAQILSLQSDETVDIVRYLFKVNPNAFRTIDGSNRTPLHVACSNPKTKPDIVHALIGYWPESTGQQDWLGMLPIHNLSISAKLDETSSLDILSRLLSFDHQSVRVADEHGNLPIHWAVRFKSPEFCRMLAHAYPESLRIQNRRGRLPIHEMCYEYFLCGKTDIIGTIQMLVQYLPESLHLRDERGNLPIHVVSERERTECTEMVRTLLLHDADLASKKNESGSLPLHLACEDCLSLEKVGLLYDAFPEAIHERDGRGKTPLDLAKEEQHQSYDEDSEVTNFLGAQLEYASQAQDTDALTTPDEYGLLPLHHALHQSASLGSIKLLVRASLSTLQAVARVRGVLSQYANTLQIASARSTDDVVHFLLELSGGDWGQVDANGNTLLHYACRGCNCDVVTFLLEKCPSLVSKRNACNKLPFHLLLESNKANADLRECIDCVRRLLLAHPETLKG